MQTIKEWLATCGLKYSSLIDLERKLADCGIDSVTPQHLSTQLKEAGFTRLTTGKLRYWIAPGFTPVTAGLQKPGNVRFLIAQALIKYLDGKDEVIVRVLHDEIGSAIGCAGFEDDINKAMALKIERNEWELVRGIKPEPNKFVRIKQQDTI